MECNWNKKFSPVRTIVVFFREKNRSPDKKPDFFKILKGSQCWKMEDLCPEVRNEIDSCLCWLIFAYFIKFFAALSKKRIFYQLFSHWLHFPSFEEQCSFLPFRKRAFFPICICKKNLIYTFFSECLNFSLATHLIDHATNMNCQQTSQYDSNFSNLNILLENWLLVLHKRPEVANLDVGSKPRYFCSTSFFYLPVSITNEVC